MTTASNAEHIVIVTGAAALADVAVGAIPPHAIVIAVDGGLDHALAAGIRPSGLVGDLDSITEAGLAWAEEHATIDRHPADKDHTDTELAVRFAADMVPARLTMIGAGDRLDHTIAALGALGHLELTSIPEIDAWWGEQHIDVVHGPGSTTLQLEPHSTLSMLALHGACNGVSIDGVRWPLDDVELSPVVGWGVSNEVSDTGNVDVRLSGGVLTIFDTPVAPTATATSHTDTTAPTNTTPNTPTTGDIKKDEHT